MNPHCSDGSLKQSKWQAPLSDSDSLSCNAPALSDGGNDTNKTNHNKEKPSVTGTDISDPASCAEIQQRNHGNGTNALYILQRYGRMQFAPAYSVKQCGGWDLGMVFAYIQYVSPLWLLRQPRGFPAVDRKQFDKGCHMSGTASEGLFHGCRTGKSPPLSPRVQANIPNPASEVQLR